MLAEAGLSFQRTRTWKASPDPDYEAKAARILELKAAALPDGGQVIAFVQMEPVSLRPTAGSGWAGVMPMFFAPAFAALAAIPDFSA